MKSDEYFQWTPELVDKFKSLWRANLTFKEMSRQLGGASKGVLQGKAKRMKLPSRDGSTFGVFKWTDELEAVFVKAWHDGLSITKIMDLIPGTTYFILMNRRSVLGLPIDRKIMVTSRQCVDWTPEMDVLLKAGWAAGLSRCKIAETIPGATDTAVRLRASKIGLPHRPPVAKPPKPVKVKAVRVPRPAKPRPQPVRLPQPPKPALAAPAPVVVLPRSLDSLPTGACCAPYPGRSRLTCDEACFENSVFCPKHETKNLPKE